MGILKIYWSTYCLFVASMLEGKKPDHMRGVHDSAGNNSLGMDIPLRAASGSGQSEGGEQSVVSSVCRHDLQQNVFFPRK